MCNNLDVVSMVFKWVNISNIKVKPLIHFYTSTATFFQSRVLEPQHHIEYALNMSKQSRNYSLSIQMDHINRPRTHGILIDGNITH